MNIGARRLHTLMEILLESLMYEASDRRHDKVVINKKYVETALSELVRHDDLSRWII